MVLQYIDIGQCVDVLSRKGKAIEWVCRRCAEIGYFHSSVAQARHDGKLVFGANDYVVLRHVPSSTALRK